MHKIAPTPPPTEHAVLPIVCPAWCTVTEQAHRDDLINWEGRVVHHSDEITDGWWLSAVSLPDGTPEPERGLPHTVIMDGCEPVDPGQVRDFALELLKMVWEASR